MPSSSVFSIVRKLSRQAVLLPAENSLTRPLLGKQFILREPPNLEESVRAFLGEMAYDEPIIHASWERCFNKILSGEIYVPLRPDITSHIVRGMSMDELVKNRLLYRTTELIQEDMLDVLGEEALQDIYGDFKPDPLYLFLYVFYRSRGRRPRKLPPEPKMVVRIAYVTNILDLPFIWALHS